MQTTFIYCQLALTKTRTKKQNEKMQCTVLELFKAEEILSGKILDLLEKIQCHVLPLNGRIWVCFCCRERRGKIVLPRSKIIK